MKRLMTLALASALVAVSMSAVEAAPPTKQEESGSILLPAPFTDGTSCFAGVHRRIAILVQENPAINGFIGHHFEVDPGTWGKPFVLEASGGVGTVDLDLTFYHEFGTPDDVAGDPLNAGSPIVTEFHTRAPGGESGIVPKDFTRVIICLYATHDHDPPTGGAAADFTYTAGKGVKLPKK